MTDILSSKKLIVFDYNGAVVTGDAKSLGTILESFFGKEKYGDIKRLEGPEKTALHRYMARDDLTKSQALELLRNFTSTNLYRQLLEKVITEPPVLMRKMDDIRANFERLPETRVAEFVINKILLPITACYSVFINNYRPVPEFRELCERSNEDILIINTNALESLIYEEIRLLSQIEGFGYLSPFLEKGLIFGNTADRSKGDSDRMQFILGEVSRKFPVTIQETISIGDGFRDCANFTELTQSRLVPQSRLFFIQKPQEGEEQPRSIEDLVRNLQARVSKLGDNKSRLEEDMKQLNVLEKMPPNQGRNVIPIDHLGDFVGRF